MVILGLAAKDANPKLLLAQVYELAPDALSVAEPPAQIEVLLFIATLAVMAATCKVEDAMQLLLLVPVTV